jgi:N-acetylneuraminate synthase
MSTPFDLESLELLKSLNLKRLKISSGEITNAPLLLAAARTGLPIVLSTGMADLAEVERALGVLAYGYLNPAAKPSGVASFRKAFLAEEGARVVRERVTLLHCTTEYPAPVAAINVFAMDTLAARFGTAVGLSDHSTGIAASVAAAARGASVIEKHLTLDKNLPGPDQKASLEPAEFAGLVKMLRDAEASLGSSEKKPVICELKNIGVARKSLVAGEKIKKGERFTEKNLTAKRPGGGISPMQYWDWLGRRADKDLKRDEPVGAS